MYMLFHCGGMIFKVPYTSLKAPGDYIYSIVGRPVFLCVVKDGISISMLFKNHTITKLKELRSLVFTCYDCSQILDGFSVMCLMSVLACILAHVF